LLPNELKFVENLFVGISKVEAETGVIDIIEGARGRKPNILFCQTGLQIVVDGGILVKHDGGFPLDVVLSVHDAM
jgi:hypothetical protein